MHRTDTVRDELGFLVLTENLSSQDDSLSSFFKTKVTYLDCNTAQITTRTDLRDYERWFWQTTAEGTSMDDEIDLEGAPFKVYQSGTYYIRRYSTKNDVNQGWSPAYPVVVDLESKHFVNGTTWYPDSDGDGYGDYKASPHSHKSCTPPVEGYVDNNLDKCPNEAGDNYGCPVLQVSEAILSSDENYIYSKVPLRPVTNIEDINSNQDILETVSYRDGFGRVLKDIAIGQSSQGHDIVQLHEYDYFIGREYKSILPYVRKENTGVYENTAESVDATYVLNDFYRKLFPADITYDFKLTDFKAYSEVTYDEQGRIAKTSAVGEDWKMGSGREIKNNYEDNTLEDRVYKLSQGENTIRVRSFYAAHQLQKTTITDEHEIVTENYTNIEGQLVLTRRAGIETYNVYDDYGNLVYVIPPKVDLSDGVSVTELNELCYQYKYNLGGQLLESKEPGKGWQYMVYNSFGQVILVQSALMREKNQWIFTKYDYQGRVTYTGIFSDVRDRATLQSEVDTLGLQVQYEEKQTTATAGFSTPLYYSNRSFPTTDIELHTINYYDNYVFDKPTAVEATKPISVYGLSITDNTLDFSTASKERVLGTDHWITSLTYYDEKGRSLYTYSENPYLHTKDYVKLQLDDFTGRLQKSRSFHKKGDQAEIVTQQTFAYDRTGRLLTQKQCIGDNTLSEYCATDTQIVADLSPITTELQGNQELLASNSILFKEGFRFKATEGQSLLATIVAHNSETLASSDEELITKNVYNELGQLVTKKVGNTEATPLQSIDYKRNIRGWLTNINDTNHLEEDLFAYKINYHNPEVEGSTALYNGNISETHWRSARDNTKHHYQYQYDVHNRLTQAMGDVVDRYDLKNVQYDIMGNITHLERTGSTNDNATTFGTIDNLSYHYDSGNQLQKVDDLSQNPQGFKNGTNTDNDYQYDIDGNLIQDKNKGIAEGDIEYNFLGLPQKIATSTGTIDMVYTASGAKLARITRPIGQPKKTKEYSGSFVYESTPAQENQLKYIHFSEGYMEPKDPSDISKGFDYVYQYTDHRGNIRLSYSDANGDGTIDKNTEIREEKHYYPFGLQHEYGTNDPRSIVQGGTSHPHGLNGIELNKDLGIDLYEMPLRSYDPTIARWTSMDPVKHYSFSTYSAFDNNPVFWSDPSGADSSRRCNTCAGPTRQEQASLDQHRLRQLTMLIDDALSSGGYTRFENNGFEGFQETVHFDEITIGNSFGLGQSTGHVGFLGGQRETFGTGVFDVLHAGSTVEGVGFQKNPNIIPLLISQRENGTSILSDLAQTGAEGNRGLSYSIGGVGEAENYAKAFEFLVDNTDSGNGYGIEFGLDIFRNSGGTQIALHTSHQPKSSLNFTLDYKKLGIEAGIRNSDFLFSTHSHKGGSIRPSKDIYIPSAKTFGGDLNNARGDNGRFKNLNKFIFRPVSGNKPAVLNQFVKSGRVIERYNTVINGQNALSGSRTLLSQMRKYGHF